MPSPAGHLIAGVAIAWAVESAGPLRRRTGMHGCRPEAPPAVTPLVLACAALALAPDLDILVASHRTFTHSIAAAGLAAVGGGAIARAFGAPGVATGLACGLAVGSHIVLDWLGRDGSTPRGLMALWPISASYFYSGLDVFADISRRYWKPEEFIFMNAVSIAREIVILAPAAGLAFWFRSRRVGAQRRLATSESRVPSPESRTQ